MIHYRCPYCQHEFETLPPSICPSCGRAMLLPGSGARTARSARKRAVRKIRQDYERQAAELRTSLPGLHRSPKLYLAVIFLFVLLAAALFHAADSARVRKTVAELPLIRAARNVDVLAEALGRYRFHTGRYPTREQGLWALVRNPLTVPKWDGPYINQLRSDPWGSPYGYEPPNTPDGLPRVFSSGPDKQAGTADDLVPVASRFNPGTAWTNGWVSEEFRLPGIRILRSSDGPGDDAR